MSVRGSIGQVPVESDNFGSWQTLIASKANGFSSLRFEGLRLCKMNVLFVNMVIRFKLG